MSIELTGEKVLVKNLREMEKKYPEATLNASYQEAINIMLVSQFEVPVDLEVLIATGFVTLPSVGAGGGDVEFGYGTDYAVFVHEDLDATHIVGKAKYLEDPVKRSSSGYISRMAKDIEKNVKLGVSLKLPAAKFPDSPKGTKG